MVTRIQAEELVANIFAMGKTICPDRFPREDPEVTAEWVGIIGPLNFPLEIWPPAVRYWATEIVGNRMITPRELKKAAQTVLTQWERDPEWRPILRARRAGLEAERDRQLKEGTFGALRGYPSRAIEGPVHLENIQELKSKALEAIRKAREAHER